LDANSRGAIDSHHIGQTAANAELLGLTLQDLNRQLSTRLSDAVTQIREL